MRIFRDVLRRNSAAVFIWVTVTAVNAAVFILYGTGLEPLLYSSLLGFFFLAVTVAAGCIKEKKRSAERNAALRSILTDWNSLPEAGSISEEDYHEMVNALGTRLRETVTEFEEEREDALDYYTTWVHQIKTPIAVMKMKLAEDTPENRALSLELFRIEQYVDMVLQYIRLGSATNDLLIREYSVDEMIRECVRKFAPQFVEKKLKLEYNGCDAVMTTDRKWFSCIVDQLLSNAVKYTPSGSVSIRVENGILSVSDTGIGIAKEDLPRIFEKGYTGRNGRLGEKSSGLGLYLCRKAADMLSIPVSVESTPGEGSTFSLDIRQKNGI